MDTALMKAAAWSLNFLGAQTRHERPLVTSQMLSESNFCVELLSCSVYLDE